MDRYFTCLPKIVLQRRTEWVVSVITDRWSFSFFSVARHARTPGARAELSCLWQASKQPAMPLPKPSLDEKKVFVSPSSALRECMQSCTMWLAVWWVYAVLYYMTGSLMTQTETEQGRGPPSAFVAYYAGLVSSTHSWVPRWWPTEVAVTSDFSLGILIIVWLLLRGTTAYSQQVLPF